MSTLPKQATIFAGSFVGLIVLFNLALYLVCLIPSERLYPHAQESYTIIANRQGYPWFFGEMASINDSYTDALIVNEICSVDSTQPFVSYMKVRKNYRPGLTEVELPDILGRAACAYYSEQTDFESFNDWYHHREESPGGQVAELGFFLDRHVHVSVDYGRYWHGYLVLFRPLFLWLNIAQIRWLMLTLFVAMYAVFLRLLAKRCGGNVALIFGSALLFSGYFPVSFSLHGCLVYAVTLASAIYILSGRGTRRNISLHFLIVGCLINYVDYLTVPLVSLGLLQALYLLKMHREDCSDKACVSFLLTSALAWLLGYAGSWLAKWVCYDMLINDGPGMVHTGLLQCLFRCSHTDLYDNPYEGAQLYLVSLVLGRALLFALLTGIIILYRRGFALPALQRLNPRCWQFVALSMYPLAWFQVLVNHVTSHHHMSWRMSLVFMLGLLLAGRELFHPGHQPTPAHNNTGSVSGIEHTGKEHHQC